MMSPTSSCAAVRNRDVLGSSSALDQLSRFQSVEARHPHIEQDQRVVLLKHQAQGLAARCRGVQRIAQWGERRLDGPEVVGAVVDDEDRQRVHRGQLDRMVVAGGRLRGALRVL
jgi:hypothetical protein